MTNTTASITTTSAAPIAAYAAKPPTFARLGRAVRLAAWLGSAAVTNVLLASVVIGMSSPAALTATATASEQA